MISISEAKTIQEELFSKVSLKSVYSSLREIKMIAGCDVSYKNDTAIATAILFSFPELEIIEKIKIENSQKEIFPYIPEYFSFREGPILIECLKKLKNLPDVTILDGHGIAHPRRMGIATYVGISLDIPAIGCAKNLLYGDCDEPPPGVKGAYNFLKDPSGEIIGIVLRTKEFVKPVFVSPGHKIDIEMAGDIVLACCKKYRIPEPLRIAHRISGDI